MQNVLVDIQVPATSSEMGAGFESGAANTALFQVAAANRRFRRVQVSGRKALVGLVATTSGAAVAVGGKVDTQPSGGGAG